MTAKTKFRDERAREGFAIKSYRVMCIVFFVFEYTTWLRDPRQGICLSWNSGGYRVQDDDESNFLFIHKSPGR